MIPVLAAALASEPVLPLPERRSGVIFPDEYERDVVYELFAFYDAQLDAWRSQPFVYGPRWVSQMPHPVALRDVGPLGAPEDADDWRRVHVRIRGHAWVREWREAGYRWVVGYVGDVVSAEPICRVVHEGHASEAFDGHVWVGATWTTRVEKTATGWFPACMAGTGAHPIGWSDVETLDATGAESLEVTFTVDALTKARVTSPMRELPSFDATILSVRSD
jgi:hypothetical protein